MDDNIKPMITDTAVIAADGTFTYDDLDRFAARVAGGLLGSQPDLEGVRVAFLSPPSFAHVAIARGIWRAGGVAVPLAVSHPPAELEYVIRDSESAVVVADPEFAGILQPIAQAAGARFLMTRDLLDGPEVNRLPEVTPDRRALIVYTSGTTARPKGVVTTHANLAAQIGSLVGAWEWTSADHTLLVLPLHHVHGIVNVVGCALAARARLEISPSFDADRTWARLASGEISVFTAVPTIYHRLIQSWEAAPPDSAARALRRMPRGAADDVRVSSASREHAGTLEGDQRPHSARALRHDGNRHGLVESAARRAAARTRRHAAAWCRRAPRG